MLGYQMSCHEWTFNWLTYIQGLVTLGLAWVKLTRHYQKFYWFTTRRSGYVLGIIIHSMLMCRAIDSVLAVQWVLGQKDPGISKHIGLLQHFLDMFENCNNGRNWIRSYKVTPWIWHYSYWEVYYILNIYVCYRDFMILHKISHRINQSILIHKKNFVYQIHISVQFWSHKYIYIHKVCNDNEIYNTFSRCDIVWSVCILAAWL